MVRLNFNSAVTSFDRTGGDQRAPATNDHNANKHSTSEEVSNRSPIIDNATMIQQQQQNSIIIEEQSASREWTEYSEKKRDLEQEYEQQRRRMELIRREMEITEREHNFRTMPPTMMFSTRAPVPSTIAAVVPVAASTSAVAPKMKKRHRSRHASSSSDESQESSSSSGDDDESDWSSNSNDDIESDEESSSDDESNRRGKKKMKAKKKKEKKSEQQREKKRKGKSSHEIERDYYDKIVRATDLSHSKSAELRKWMLFQWAMAKMIEREEKKKDDADWRAVAYFGKRMGEEIIVSLDEFWKQPPTMPTSAKVDRMISRITTFLGRYSRRMSRKAKEWLPVPGVGAKYYRGDQQAHYTMPYYQADSD